MVQLLCNLLRLYAVRSRTNNCLILTLQFAQPLLPLPLFWLWPHAHCPQPMERLSVEEETSSHKEPCLFLLWSIILFNLGGGGAREAEKLVV